MNLAKESICIIPARGGSKRIPRKNLVDFAGIPLIAHSIKNAINSGVFDYVVVSSDDEEILSTANKFGALTPFVRPANLSDDFTSTADVVCHAIIECERLFGISFKTACCLYATAPLISSEILAAAAQKFEILDKKFLFSICEFGYPIQRALRLFNNGVAMFEPKHALTRSQDLEPAFHDAGAFYFGLKKAWLDGELVFSSHSNGFILPRHLVCDIDTLQDLEFARKLYQIEYGTK